jgi:hypothetical protein
LWPDGPAVAEIIHQLRCGRQINSAPSQSSRDFVRRAITANHLFGQFDICLQDVVCHASNPE